ncbi:MAG TPA: DUF5698 domain-containing protein [bacterium]|nr:DUF5698 domain-containing protein [bacterium]HPN43153.1 DUF5698 domain-containing protein [bacterium]
MNSHFESAILITGILVFCSRVIDVTLGTLRTINIVQGRTKIAFILGFFEISMWLVVLSTVLPQVVAKPILGLFYALGFSTGNVVGIIIERKIALGHTIFRVITAEHGEIMATALRNAGYAVTTFEGTGLKGKVIELYVVCDRKNLREIIPIINSIDPNAFYITEQAGDVSKVYRPTMVPKTGWRAIIKKK